jgi:iduronate 2-sulfatase
MKNQTHPNLSRRSFLQRSGAALAAAAAAQRARAAETRQFNMLFMISDDLNNALGCYGHPIVQTPNLDRFAERALRFDRAYCQFPLCNPSRSSLMTGLYPDETGVHSNRELFRDRHPDVATMPQWFRQHGYEAARIGKLYHYGVPRQIGTDGLDDPLSWDRVVNPYGRDKHDEDIIYSLEPGKFGGTLSWLAAEGDDADQTDGIGAREAVRLMSGYEDRPYFLGMGFYRPHTPFVAPRKYFDLYPLKDVAPPPFPEEWAWRSSPLVNSKPEQRTMTERERREAAQAYYASISFLDAQIGVVLDGLEEAGLADNTVVAFTSDHGYHIGDHGLWQKRSLFERSARVPLLLSVPGVPPASRSTNQLAELVDLYPTFADCCGLPIPEHCSGVSLKPLLTDPTAPTKDVALTMDTRRVREDGRWETFNGYSIRHGNWRYTEWDNGKRGVELYDYETDPHEQNNLADEADHVDLHSEMAARLDTRLSEIAEA